MTDQVPRYLLDTNVFIDAHKRYYAFNLCPGFWNSLVWLSNQGRVLSLDKVQKEIFDGSEDALTTWAKSEMAHGFVPSEDADVVAWYAKLQAWAQSQPQYTPAARAEFAREPDAWIVAYAKSKKLTLVTHEAFKPDAKARIPIPNACRAAGFAVECTDPFKMLSALGVQFHWKE